MLHSLGLSNMLRNRIQAGDNRHSGQNNLAENTAPMGLETVREFEAKNPQ
jgi:hypothetical protein